MLKKIELKKIKATEKMLTEKLGLDIEITAINKKEMIFTNNNNGILKFFAKVDRKTFKILDIEVYCNYYAVQLSLNETKESI